MSRERVLLTGATGFVGGALYPELVRLGFDVRCATREPERARRNPGWAGRQVVRFEALDAATVNAALEGCDVAYYLIHSMADRASQEGHDYEEKEARAARCFADAARARGVRRVVYLGGMRPAGEPSKHLRSRLHTGELLRGGAVSTIELRAGMIVGQGSESWRMVRDLSARLPAMVLPRWLENRSEPVWVGDVVAALLAAGADAGTGSAAYSVPGPDVLSAREVLRRAAAAQGLTPVMVSVPFVTPKLSSYWIALVSGADVAVAAELVHGLTSDIVGAPGDDYWRRMPGGYQPLGFDEAARRELAVGAAELSPRTRLAEGVARRVARLVSSR